MTIRRAALALFVVLAAVAAVATNARADAAPITVIVPDPDNLQYMAFWVAKGAGYFKDEGIDVETLAAPAPPATEALVRENKAAVFLLPPPVYIALIADKFPLYLVANLLQNDPIDLVVRRSVYEDRKMSATAPLADRLASMRGLRVGVAPGPPTRLRALFASPGMDADKDIAMKIIRGPDQNDAFAKGEVDALYCHTPFLEKAIDEQDAVMLVNQSAGDVPRLALRQIHALAMTRDFADRNKDTAVAMVRAIHKAESLIHGKPNDAVDAILRVFPSMKRSLVATIVRIYEPAIPTSPRVSADAIAPALALFPASKSPPDLSKIDLREYVAPAFAERALAMGAFPSPSGSRFGRFVPLAVLAMIAAIGVVAYRVRRRV